MKTSILALIAILAACDGAEASLENDLVSVASEELPSAPALSSKLVWLKFADGSPLNLPANIAPLCGQTPPADTRTVGADRQAVVSTMQQLIDPQFLNGITFTLTKPTKAAHVIVFTGADASWCGQTPEAGLTFNQGCGGGLSESLIFDAAAYNLSPVQLGRAALHELGHQFGLQHSYRQTSLMYASVVSASIAVSFTSDVLLPDHPFGCPYGAQDATAWLQNKYSPPCAADTTVMSTYPNQPYDGAGSFAATCRSNFGQGGPVVGCTADLTACCGAKFLCTL